jgi:hypothetical protein
MTMLNLYRVYDDCVFHWVTAANDDHALRIVYKQLEESGCKEDAGDMQVIKLDEKAGRAVSLMEDDEADNMWDAHLQSTKGRYLACSEW